MYEKSIAIPSKVIFERLYYEFIALCMRTTNRKKKLTLHPRANLDEVFMNN